VATFTRYLDHLCLRLWFRSKRNKFTL